VVRSNGRQDSNQLSSHNFEPACEVSSFKSKCKPCFFLANKSEARSRLIEKAYPKGSAAERLKKQAVENAKKFADKNIASSLSYNDKEFKRIYRANREQVSSFITFDLSLPIYDNPDEGEFAAASNIASNNEESRSPNPFAGVSSISFSNSSIDNPEDLEIYFSSALREMDTGSFPNSERSRGVENPEEEFFL
jgi:hypothetical protein